MHFLVIQVVSLEEGVNMVALTSIQETKAARVLIFGNLLTGLSLSALRTLVHLYPFS